MLISLVLVMALHAEEKNEAEVLFGQMEMKLLNAKTTETDFEAKFERGRMGGSFKGELLLGEGNKLRFEMSGELGGKMAKSTRVSDGAKMVIMESDKPTVTKDAVNVQNDILRAGLARTGPGALLFFGFMKELPADFKADEHFKVSDFKLGKKEKVGEKEAQIVEYQLAMKGIPEKFAVQVWVDTKSNLPLKRELTLKFGESKFAISETYPKVELDGKIDSKKFELPKE
jgi:outer membrane lipoprotein-sorting protein